MRKEYYWRVKLSPQRACNYFVSIKIALIFGFFLVELIYHEFYDIIPWMFRTNQLWNNADMTWARHNIPHLDNYVLQFEWLLIEASFQRTAIVQNHKIFFISIFADKFHEEEENIYNFSIKLSYHPFFYILKATNLNIFVWKTTVVVIHK